MKKVIYSALLMGALAFVSSCGNDDDTTEPTTTTEVGTIDVVDDGSGTGTNTWTNDNIYILDGFVFVNDGQTLTIEEGTIIKGKAGQGTSASALIVARGCKIIAEGTPDKPIIFTSAADGIKGFDDGTSEEANNLSKTDAGLWGGLMILGKAKTNNPTTEKAIEGIPASETRGLYGGTDDSDNSGSLKYISIRHGGTDIGEGNEINGLTLGAVGNGTTIEHIEVFANQDDGIEFFGGTVGVKWALTAFCGDDSYDYDEGFRGNGQFWVTIQEEGGSDRGGEHDGGNKPDDGIPYAIPTIYNATYIGNSASRAITFRDNAGGHYANSIFHNFAKGIDVEDQASGEDSKARLDAGDLTLTDLIFSDVTASELLLTQNSDGDIQDTLTTSHSNISGITTASDLGLSFTNPVPTGGDVSGATAASDSWFTTATYKGAFDPAGSNWLKGWSALDKKSLLD